MTTPLIQVGYADITVSTTAVVIPDLPASATRALIYVEGGPIRWRADDTSPTSSVGMYVAAGNYIDWTDPNWDYRTLLDSMRFIRQGGSDATLRVVYFA